MHTQEGGRRPIWPKAARHQERKAMNSARSPAIAAALVGVAGLALLLPVYAGGDKVAFPENYAAGILYGTVDRYDVKQYREQYAPAAAIEAERKGQPIPSGTVLTM